MHIPPQMLIKHMYCSEAINFLYTFDIIAVCFGALSSSRFIARGRVSHIIGRRVPITLIYTHGI